MTDPSPYPETDAAECRAVLAFEAALDLDHVKPDIKRRDKTPNYDGVLEVVDDHLVPIGKLDVQVRKIKKDATTYQCPAALVAYSQNTTLPLILVCVDVDNARVFWKHITRFMPEYQARQDSFVIHFDPTVDGVNESGVYLRRWAEIIRDYRTRIAQYPSLKQEVDSTYGLAGVRREDVVYFQRFIDTVNHLFDDDFVAVKKMVLADVWKLGVGIYGADDTWVSYQLYKVLYGENVPLLTQIEGHPFDLFKDASPRAFSSSMTQRTAMPPAEEHGKRYVLDLVKDVAEKRLFSVKGRYMSIEYLFAFIDRYYFALGFNLLDSYETAEISHALYVYLPTWFRIVLDRFVAQEYDKWRHLAMDFDMILSVMGGSRIGKLAEEVTRARSEGLCSWSVPLMAHGFSFKALFESIEYIRATGLETIDRPYRLPALLNTPGTRVRWIWDGYSIDDLQHNVSLLLTQAPVEYAEFVRGNALRFDSSYFLSDEYALVYLYDFEKQIAGTDMPILQDFIVKNPGAQLPKASVHAPGDRAPMLIKGSPALLELDGRRYEVVSAWTQDASHLFDRYPMSNLIYRMLGEDLLKHYGLRAFLHSSPYF